MSTIDDLSAKVSEAVFRQVEQDRALNRNNIQDAVRKEILAARPESDKQDSSQSLVAAAREFREAIYAENMPATFSWSLRTVRAYEALGEAIRREE